MFTVSQIIAHLVGDYIFQSHWMATNKTSKWYAAMFHTLTYLIPFLLLQPSLLAFLVMGGSHYLIDRYRLARYVCRWKNVLGDPTTLAWENKAQEYNTDTGYHKDTPPWLAFWLLVITDNIIHVLINGAALTYL